MYLKDKLSYEKKEGWNEYKKNSYILFPKIFPSLILNTVVYTLIVLVIVYIARMGNVDEIGQKIGI